MTRNQNPIPVPGTCDAWGIPNTNSYDTFRALLHPRILAAALCISTIMRA